MSHKDPNSVYPMDLAKPQIPRNDHFFNRFCSPCYHVNNFLSTIKKRKNFRKGKNRILPAFQ